MKRLIFNHNFIEIELFLKRQKNDVCDYIMNKIDRKGNTPLLLAMKLAHSHQNYTDIIKCLLYYGAIPSIRDLNGWSALDEAISQVNYFFLRIIHL